MATPENEIIALKEVRKYFPVTGGLLKKEVARVNVLNSVSLSINHGEIFGLVGESGCGKSTLAKLLVKLHEPSDGKIYFEKRDINNIKKGDKKHYFKNVQMIFQDPYSSLNPRLKIRTIIGEMVQINEAKKDEKQDKVKKIMTDVGLDVDSLSKYPHEFSGGQRQRIAIARALVMQPKLLIADEPVSALDLSIQAQILALLNKLKHQYNLTILFISHDLNTVVDFCDRVGVMYLGRLVEIIPAKLLFSHGRHPYLKALLESIPVSDPDLRHRERNLIRGEVPSPLNMPSGCPFHTRCPLRQDLCVTENPPLIKRGNGHETACHFV